MSEVDEEGEIQEPANPALTALEQSQSLGDDVVVSQSVAMSRDTKHPEHVDDTNVILVDVSRDGDGEDCQNESDDGSMENGRTRRPRPSRFSSIYDRVPPPSSHQFPLPSPGIRNMRYGLAPSLTPGPPPGLTQGSANGFIPNLPPYLYPPLFIPPPPPPGAFVSQAGVHNSDFSVSAAGMDPKSRRRKAKANRKRKRKEEQDAYEKQLNPATNEMENVTIDPVSQWKDYITDVNPLKTDETNEATKESQVETCGSPYMENPVLLPSPPPKPSVDLARMKAAALNGCRKKLGAGSLNSATPVECTEEPRSDVPALGRDAHKNLRWTAPTAGAKQIPEIVFTFESDGDDEVRDSDDDSQDSRDLGDEINAAVGTLDSDGGRINCGVGCRNNGQNGEKNSGCDSGGSGVHSEGDKLEVVAPVLDAKRAKLKELADLRRKVLEYEESKKIAKILQDSVAKSDASLSGKPCLKSFQVPPGVGRSVPVKVYANAKEKKKLEIALRIAELEKRRKEKQGTCADNEQCASGAPERLLRTRKGEELVERGNGLQLEAPAYADNCGGPPAKPCSILQKGSRVESAPDSTLPRDHPLSSLSCPHGAKISSNKEDSETGHVTAPWNEACQGRESDYGVREVRERGLEADKAESARLLQQLKALNDESSLHRKADIAYARASERLEQSQKNVEACRHRLQEALEEEALCVHEARKTKNIASKIEESFRRNIRHENADEDVGVAKIVIREPSEHCIKNWHSDDESTAGEVAELSAKVQGLDASKVAPESTVDVDLLEPIASVLSPTPLTPNPFGPYRSPLGILRPYVWDRTYGLR